MNLKIYLTGALLLINIHSKSQHNPWADSCSKGSFVGTVNSTSHSGLSAFNTVHEYPGGDIIATGYYKPTNETGPAERRYGLIMRVSPAGQMKWAREMGFTATRTDTRLYCSVIASNGDIIVAGEESQTEPGGIIFRIDGNGNLIWKHKYIITGSGFSGSDVWDQVIETTDGGFLIGGTRAFKAFILKINAAGSITWQKDFALNTSLNFRSVTETPSGYFFTGFNFENANGENSQNVLVKLKKEDGNIIWSKGFQKAAPYTEYSYEHMVYKDGLLHLSGTTHRFYNQGRGPNSPAQTYLTITEEGVITSFKRIENPVTPALYTYGNDRFRTFDFETKTGIQFNYTPDSDFYIYRLDDQFNQQWGWRFPFTGKELGTDMQVMKDSSIAIAGTTELNNPYLSKAILVKTFPSGQISKCNSLPFEVKTTDLTATVSNINITSQSFPDSARTTTIPLFDGNNFIWELECDSTIATCKLGKIEGPFSVCINTPVLFKSARSGACMNVINYSTNSNTTTIQITSDTSAHITFKDTGTVILYSSMPSECGILKDSITISVVSAVPPVDIGPDKYLCQNAVALRAGPGYKSYSWSNGSTDSITAVSNAGKFYVTVTDHCNNVSSDTVQIISSQILPFNIGNDTGLCSGDTIVLHATAGYQNYTWTPAYNIIVKDPLTAKVFPAKDTFYMATATAFPGCELVDTIAITVKMPPALFIGNDTTICENTTLRLQANGFTSYLWNTGITGPSIVVKDPGAYWLTATGANGCKAADTIIVKVEDCSQYIFFPNAFTANGDNLNDVFKPLISGRLRKYKLSVYNAWGQLIFETQDPKKGWDGKFQQFYQSVGAYVYMATYQFEGSTENRLKGVITLLR